MIKILRQKITIMLSTTIDNNVNDDLNTDNVPGVDENDNMFKDDEKDNDPDPEDAVEDMEDMGDRDKRDE